MYSPNFRKIIVNKALEDYYSLNKDMRARQRVILKDCQNFPNRVYIKTTLRLQRMDINMILIEAYISTLSEEYKNYLEYKFVKKLMTHQIASLLNTSDSSLTRIHNFIVADIGNLMFYGISDNMMFNEKLLMNLVNVFNDRVHFIEDNALNEDWLDMKWFNAIVYQRDRFSLMLQHLQDCLREDPKDLYSLVVYYKSQNLQETAIWLAAQCNTSQPAVSHSLKKYKSNLLKFLDEKLSADKYGPRTVA